MELWHLAVNGQPESVTQQYLQLVLRFSGLHPYASFRCLLDTWGKHCESFLALTQRQ